MYTLRFPIICQFFSSRKPRIFSHPAIYIDPFKSTCTENIQWSICSWSSKLGHSPVHFSLFSWCVQLRVDMCFSVTTGHYMHIYNITYFTIVPGAPYPNNKQFWFLVFMFFSLGNLQYIPLRIHYCKWSTIISIGIHHLCKPFYYQRLYPYSYPESSTIIPLMYPIDL
jgi:hypothetical protein